MHTMRIALSMLALTCLCQFSMHGQSFNTTVISKHGATASCVDVQDGVAYIGTDLYLETVNVSDPYDPRQLDKVQLSDKRAELILDVAVHDSWAWVLAYPRQLITINAWSPSSLNIMEKEVSWIENVFSPGAKTDSALFFSIGTVGISIPFYGPNVPFAKGGGCNFRWYASQVDADHHGNRYFIQLGRFRLCDSHEGMVLDYPGAAEGVVAFDVVGTHAYLVRNESLDILDISDFSTVDTASRVSIGYDYQYVYVKDGFAYIYGGAGDILIVDVQDPYSTEVVGRYAGGGSDVINDLVVVDNLIYAATSFNGLVVIRNDAIVSAPSPQIRMSFSLAPAFPNPTSSMTSIPYTIPDRQFVNMELYDSFGRLVYSLHNGVQVPGKHIRHFDAGALVSGIYRIVMKSPTKIRSMNIVVK
jgi:LVIVD repeat-containing protein